MLKMTAFLVAASMLAGCDCSDPLWKSITQKGIVGGRACPPEDLGPLYDSVFPKGSPDCCLVDRFPDGPKQLAKGQSNTGETADADPVRGVLKLVAPNKFETDPVLGDKSVSVGLFRTALAYGPGTVLTARATFRRLEGPLDDLAWSVGVAARDGGVDDLFNAARVSATLKVKQGHAYLNIGAGADPSDRDSQADIGDVYRLIFNGDQSQPFTLSLHIDRTAGADSTVSLMKDGRVLKTLRFKLDPTLKDAVFTTVGPTLADCCVAKAQLSAELTDFQIL